MKQVIQNAKGGKLRLKEVPAPGVHSRSLLIKTEASLISSGTERQMVGFAQSNLMEKARARPDLVKKVVDKVRRDGPVATFKSVVARLDEPLPLGYSAAGRVLEVGAGLEGAYKVGQLVAVAGIAIANHAEFNVVPENLAVPVPEDVTAEQACFSTLSSIALHSVRLIGPALGDYVAVLGAGLVGLLAAQFARLSGARVIVLDYNKSRLALAKQLGAEVTVDLSAGDPTESILDVTRGIGCDAVLVAAATKSSEPFETAAAIARDRAKVCLVGITGTEFPYRPYMQKELSILVSRSYGPGRYDRDYENKHVKYPLGYVRWTENENLRECARLMSPSLVPHLDVDALVSHRFSFSDSEKAYDLVLNGTEPHLGVVLRYDAQDVAPTRAISLRSKGSSSPAKAVISAIGAGSFGKTMILPALKEAAGVKLKTLVTSRGVSSEGSGEKFGFATASTDIGEILGDAETSAVVITTPHATHADLVAKFLGAGKSVFVEKPLALTHDELAKVVEARNASDGFFMVGFNRRFAPYVQEARQFIASRQGRTVVSIRVNAGQLPPESWQRDAEEGNGRILGELCHFVDLAMFLVGQPVQTVSASGTAARGLCEDVGTSIVFADGSLVTIVYTALGDTSFSKELIECYKGGAVCSIDNFRELLVVANGKTVTKKTSVSQDKGHKAQIEAFVAGVTSGAPPVDEQSLIDSSAATLAVVESLRVGHPVDMSEPAEGVAAEA